MKLKDALGSTVAIALMGATTAASAVSFTPIGFTGNGNIQAELISSGPSGNLKTSNGFATPFSIPTSGDNFAAVSTSAPLSITGLSFAGVTDVYTLINASSPVEGTTIGAITFNFVGGTSESIDLVAGDNVRDYYDGDFADSITASNVENAFTYTGTQGGATTGNASTGLTGTYFVDEQDFSLGSAATGKILSGIEITNSGVGVGSPLVLGVTVETMPPAVPEPSTWTMLLMGFAGLGAVMRRRSAATARELAPA
jgi:hypothetical protein